MQTRLCPQTCQKRTAKMTSSLLHYERAGPERCRNRAWPQVGRRVDLAQLTACWIAGAKAQSALWETVAYRSSLHCKTTLLPLPFRRLECMQDGGQACSWQQTEWPSASPAGIWFGSRTFQSCSDWKQRQSTSCQCIWQLCGLSAPRYLEAFVGGCIYLPWKGLLEERWLYEEARGLVEIGLAWQGPCQSCPE